MNIKFIFCVIFLCAALALPAQASAPLPQRKTENTQARLAAAEENKAALAARLKQAEKEFQATKKELLEIADEARSGEKLVAALESRMTALQAEQEALKAKLESDYGSMAELILALERLRRVPPEALILRPGAPLETAQTALLLRRILPALNHRAAGLSADLQRLDEIRQTLDNDRQKAMEAKAATQKKYQIASALAKKREKLFRETSEDYEETAAEAARIAAAADSMPNLLDRLGEGRKVRASRTSRPWSMPKPGKPELPAPGVILTGFNETDRIGARSEGLLIETPPGALAVAPMGGMVKFAGSFRNYGKMVILEHEKGYHSLIGGLEDITAAIGQSLDAGEPLGKLPAVSSRGARPVLYYELRYKGQAVNPSMKFPGLKS